MKVLQVRLLVLARHLEGRCSIQQTAALDNTLRQIVDGIVSCRQKLRPNRSYDRCSRAGGKMETPQVGKGHRNEMKEKTRRPAGKPQGRGLKKSEWRFSLSECHWGGGGGVAD